MNSIIDLNFILFSLATFFTKNHNACKPGHGLESSTGKAFMSGSPSFLSECLHLWSMLPSTGEGFLLCFMPLPSATLGKSSGCQRSHEPTHFSTVTAGVASSCRRGFVLWHRVCHCCDTWGPACPAVPTWTLLQGCSVAHLALTSQAFSSAPAIPSAANLVSCHGF